jgi:hypothetical protein
MAGLMKLLGQERLSEITKISDWTDSVAAVTPAKNLRNTTVRIFID